MDVLTILTNYLRPGNVSQIITALKNQSEPTEIIVVDNSPKDSPVQSFEGVRDVWRMYHNYGPPCRFSPALLEQDSKYILFYDDDMLPGPNMIEHLLKCSDLVQDNFSTIGEIGRCLLNKNRRGRFRRKPSPVSPYIYTYKNVPRESELPVSVDVTCRAHLVHTDHVRYALDLKWNLIGINQGLRTAVYRHDDILLSLGIQLKTGLKSYLVPLCSPCENMFYQVLPNNNAASSRPTHLKERQSMIEHAHQFLGWSSLVEDTRI